jgi:hypothetical protein
MEVTGNLNTRCFRGTVGADERIGSEECNQGEQSIISGGFVVKVRNGTRRVGVI